jgi:hypothetical protein
MTIDTSIGLDPRRTPTSGIDDEERAKKARADGESVESDRPASDPTREDIESGNDRNVSADQGNRSGRTNKLPDEGIEIGVG